MQVECVCDNTTAYPMCSQQEYFSPNVKDTLAKMSKTNDVARAISQPFNHMIMDLDIVKYKCQKSGLQTFVV